jgi:hypothetical protein
MLDLHPRQKWINGKNGRYTMMNEIYIFRDDYFGKNTISRIKVNEISKIVISLKDTRPWEETYRWMKNKNNKHEDKSNQTETITEETKER